MPRFEQQDVILMNVFTYSNGVFRLYVTTQAFEEIANLMLITTDGTSHNCYIKDFNQLIATYYMIQLQKFIFQEKDFLFSFFLIISCFNGFCAKMLI